MSESLCEYIHRCPSVSGWCHAGIKPAARCIEFILHVMEQERQERNSVLYLCDRRACNHCRPECKHTTDPRHAVNFSAGLACDRPVLIEQEKKFDSPHLDG